MRLLETVMTDIGTNHRKPTPKVTKVNRNGQNTLPTTQQKQIGKIYTGSIRIAILLSKSTQLGVFFFFKKKEGP